MIHRKSNQTTSSLPPKKRFAGLLAAGLAAAVVLAVGGMLTANWLAYANLGGGGQHKPYVQLLITATLAIGAGIISYRYVARPDH